ncbi:hypothetical protein CERSUDRAFT_112224 [Gelatoporia subvermispora B]|uniref:Oxidoreductase AflY n=1 Tax=Ceriporiopsis subvermispora (strain B) TaxID=914234 RepID=M2R5Y7_CERS8|nr:hypothetical protein CERSUDRAFT_112224 [Gelatoporia subvermispora B]
MSTLPSTISQGLLNFPGATPESKATAERLLEEDRNRHHCFWGKVGFHNHLSHHILAVYDLGASSKLLQAIYDDEAKGLNDIFTVDKKSGVVERQEVEIGTQNWPEYLGQDKYYANYLEFFKSEVAKYGIGEALERYVFSSEANANGAQMYCRFYGGAVHPWIQIGNAVEFNSPPMLAQALAQTAVHSPLAPEIFDFSSESQSINGVKSTVPGHRHPSKGQSLLAILRQAYDSQAMTPVMPYDNDALINQRFRDALKDGRSAEIKRLSAQWEVDAERGQVEFDEKVEEALWVATLLLAGSGKPGRKPRLDFFLMHLLNASLFLPSLIKVLPSAQSKVALLRGVPAAFLLIMTTRGRPVIKPDLLMSYSATPRPPCGTDGYPAPDGAALGDPRDNESVNPWPTLVAAVVHCPDAHTPKALRALCYAAQKYGTTPAGGAIGAFDTEGRETHEGTSRMDGTIFVRAAGVVMDILGWVSHGQENGVWDRSALGWEDAWKNED